ncbi:endoglucanase [Plakobranchus ocellatus]|uniref:cellulase n=1 Tax=Plakobranchus ocellatus TaxID=259542 RepID=A0AAV4DEJ0_9GAST|nr:endoglucanase [Plakobranchus ocellatus]
MLQSWPGYNYGEVLYKSILFYEVQRSGCLPSNRNIQWRGDSAVNDRGASGEDLTGGWYDSGDYVKFGLPMASSVTMLLYGLLEFPEAYSSASLLDDVRDCVKWPLDYFLKAHTDKYGFYGQVGDPYVDHTYWGRPEDMTMNRPAYKLTPEQPGSDLIGETSAAMAAGYLAFKDVEPQFAERLLTHAQILFAFAENFRGYYSDSIPSAAEFYQSHSDEDELAWAAAWLYRATGHRRYLTKAGQWLRLAPTCWAQSWADKTCGATVRHNSDSGFIGAQYGSVGRVLLYQVTKAAGLREMVDQTFQAWLPGGGIHYTPKGLAYRDDWGTLRYTANMAFLSLVAAQTGVNSDLYRRWAMGQIHYMLGDSGRSFVVGFGKDPPTRPHHASSSCRSPPYPCNWDDYSKPEANAHTLYGALVGGPGPRDEYLDTREDYIHNEVSCEYNGGFQSAVAALRHLELNLL